MKTFTKFLMATVARGVEEVDAITMPTLYPDHDLLSFRDFMSELSGLGDDEVIFTSCDPDEFNEVNEEYGVKQ